MNDRSLFCRAAEVAAWGIYSGALLRLLELDVAFRKSRFLWTDVAIGFAGEIFLSIVLFIVLVGIVGGIGKAAGRQWAATPFERMLLATIQAVGIFLFWYALRIDIIDTVTSPKAAIGVGAIGFACLLLFFFVRDLKTPSRRVQTTAAFFILGLPLLAVIDAGRRPIVPVAPVTDEEQRVRPNLLLIVVDTLRKDRVDPYSDRQLMPNIGRLATDGYLFENAVSSAPWTGPSMASTMTSLYPSVHGVHHQSVALHEDALTLAEVLCIDGYATAGLVSNSVLNQMFGFDQGFDVYLDTKNAFPFGFFLEAATRIWQHKFQAVSPAPVKRFFHRVNRDYALAERTTHNAERILDELAEGPRPFFFFLHYMDPHRPYHAPGRFREEAPADYDGPVDGFAYMEYDSSRAAMTVYGEEMDETDFRRYDDLYDAEARHVDTNVGRVLDRLALLGLDGETAIFFIADHGEYFGEHNLAAHSHLYAECIDVPLLYRPPGGLPGAARIATVVQNTQIFPTILELADIEDRKGVILPAEPLPFAPPLVDAEPPAFAEAEVGDDAFQRMVRVGDWKLIRNPGSWELYDLANDPRESLNLHGVAVGPDTPIPPERLTELEELLATFTEKMEASRGNAVPLTREQEEALRGLGYIQ